MSFTQLIGSVGTMLLSGQVYIVDCIAMLGPETPILNLPKGFAKNTPKVEIHPISEYDADGSFFAWNWLKLGEHSGPYFDATHHWVSGREFRDGYTDKLDVQRLIAQGNVLDCSKDCSKNPDFLLMVGYVKAQEAKYGDINSGEWVVMRSDWDAQNHDKNLFLNEDLDWHEAESYSPGPTTECMDVLLSKGTVGWGSQRIGTDAGMAGKFSPPYPALALVRRV